MVTMGLSTACVGFWLALVGAMALFALPTIFLRLEFARVRALAILVICLVLTAGATLLLRPVFVHMGGMFKFFANTLPLGIYTIVLAIAFRVGRAR